MWDTRSLVISAALALQTSLASAEAYIGQLDGGAGSGTPQTNAGVGPAYIEQLPADARPAKIAPSKPKKRTIRKAAAAQLPTGPAAAVVPSVGAGVLLALSQAKGAAAVPTVGAGVVKP